jgi:anaerobic selenocysteine-containing dehydrogenase
LTDTADHADIVLPATTQLEHLDIHGTYGHTDLMINEPAVQPLGEAKPNTQIFRELAARMGFRDACFADDDEALARQAIDWAALGASFEQLRERGWISLPLPDAPFAEGGFATPNGKARVEAGSLGVPTHLDNHECAEATPELAARYPLAMISPPARHFLNSSFVNVRSLRSIEGEPLLEMHADDAAPRGIASGMQVRVFNDRGDYRCTVQVNDRARPGVVNGLGVWWRKFGRDGTNVNELTHQKLTDLGAAPAFYDCLVEVQAVAAARV